MSSVKNDAAARAAAEAARRRAEEEARKRAAEAAKKAVADAAKKASVAKAAAQSAAPKKSASEAAKKFGRDELSTGVGGALRRSAASLLGATGLPSPSAPTTARPLAAQAAPAAATTFTRAELLRAQQQGLPVTKTALSAQASGSYDIEEVRAQRAQQQALDAATAGLPPERAKQVQDSARAVAAASNGITDPVQRAQATADAIAAQSEQFKNDPAAAQAFAQAIAPQVQGLGSTLGAAVTKHGDDPETRPVLEALAKAADNLGTGGAMALGRSLAAGLPDTDDLYHFDDVLEDLAARGGGGQALTFGIAAGLEAQGKAKSLDDLQDELRNSTIGMSPGEVNTPVDPNDPDAVAKAELKLAMARVMMPEGGLTQQDLYAGALQVQLDALEGNPALQQQLAQSQMPAVTELMQTSTLDGWRLSTALQAAQAAGPEQLQRLCDTYADQLGQTRLDLSSIAQSVSPEIATSLAFSFARVGNTEMAATFANRAADMLDGVAARATKANDEVATLQAQLDTELSNVGAALTEDQKKQYAAAFWDKHHDAVDEQKAANAALKSALSTDLPTLQKLAELDPAAAKSVASCLKELARDPAQAQWVSSTVDQLSASGAFPAGLQGVEQELVEAKTTAVNTLAHKALAAGDAAGAAELLKQLHGFLKKTKFVTDKVTTFVNKQLPMLEEFTSVVADAVRTKDLSKITDWLKGPKASALAEPGTFGEGFGKLIGSVTTAVGMAVLLNQAASAPDGQEKLMAVIKAGNAGAKLVAQGFEAISGALREATNQALREGAAALGDLSKAINKITPVIGLAVDVLSGFQSIQDAAEDPNLRTVGAAIGDTLGVIGGAVALIPGGQVPGAVIGAIGAGISLVTNFIQGRNEDNARKAEQQELLIGVLTSGAKDPKSPYYGLSEQQVRDVAARLSNTGADLNKLAQDAGLTPGQLVQLAVSTPVMGERVFHSMNEIARLSGLEGQAFLDWVKGMPDLEDKLYRWISLNVEGGIIQSAGMQADAYAQAELAKGNDYAEAYERKYRELYDQQLRGLMQAQGLIP